jgi:hypothetical protein
MVLPFLFKYQSTEFLAGCLCPLCNEIYQMTCHRPIGEMLCGHIICYQCFVLNTNQFGCVQCETSPEVIWKDCSSLLFYLEEEEEC